jgi:hypothetical protein
MFIGGGDSRVEGIDEGGIVWAKGELADEMAEVEG